MSPNCQFQVSHAVLAGWLIGRVSTLDWGPFLVNLERLKFRTQISELSELGLMVGTPE